MPGSRITIRDKSTPRTPALKEAIVASFALDPDAGRMRLAGFDEPDWCGVLRWLDIHGLAIYFCHRAREIGAVAMLPRRLKEELAQRWSNNLGRTKSLFDEARAV